MFRRVKEVHLEFGDLEKGLRTLRLIGTEDFMVEVERVGVDDPRSGANIYAPFKKEYRELPFGESWKPRLEDLGRRVIEYLVDQAFLKEEDANGYKAIREAVEKLA